jgi:hypothetical protein
MRPILARRPGFGPGALSDRRLPELQLDDADQEQDHDHDDDHADDPDPTIS